MTQRRTIDLNEIKKAMLEATPGPWGARGTHLYLLPDWDSSSEWMTVADAHYIALVNPEAMAEILTRLEVAEQAVNAAEREEQRRSFAYGNTHLSNPNVTRDMIDAAADRIDAAKPCPECNGTGWIESDDRWLDGRWLIQCECQRETGGEGG